MSVEEIKRFCNHFWTHPYFTAETSPTHSIRLSFLPSKYMGSNYGGKLPVRGIPSEGDVSRKDLEEKIPRILANNQRGFDCYYFCNPVRSGKIEKYARNEDIAQRIYLPLDLDFRLPCSVDELTGEFGLEPWAVIESSCRNGSSRYQILYALDISESVGEHALRELSRDLCWVFGSDPIHEPKRILRLPGTINWKGVEQGGEASEAKIVRLGDKESVWPFDELRHAVKAFESEALSKELRSLGLKPVSAGGKIDDAALGILRGDNRAIYGSWKEALEKGKEGKWSIGEGGRHNALCTWGVQMAASRLPWNDILRNLETLRRVAFEIPYEDDRDFGRLVQGVKQKWESIDGELDAVMGCGKEGEGGEGEVVGGEETVTAPECSDQVENSLPLEINGNESLVTNVGDTEHSGGVTIEQAQQGPAAPRPPQPPQSIQPPQPSQPPQKNVNYLVEFARRLSLRGDGESEKDYLDFLAQVLAAANFFSNKKIGNISRLGQLLAARLEWAGCARGRFYSVPRWYSSAIPHWGMSELNEDQATVLIKDFISELSAQVVRNRKKIQDHPAVVASNASVKEPQYVFAAQGALMSQAVTDVLDRGSTIDISESSGQENIIAFQNGYFELDKWARGEIGIDDPVRALRECWHPNRASEGKDVKGVRRGLSWQKYFNAIACDFDFEGALAYLQARLDGQKQPASILETPQFDAFLETPFPGEEEKDSWIGLLRIIGYCFLPDNPVQKYFYFEGLAGGGKGTIAELILSLVGGKNSSRLQFSRLLSDAWLGPLEGKSVVLIDEAESADIKVHKVGVSELARVTGGDFASARKLYGDSRDIRCTQKFILTTNRALEADDIAGQQARRAVPLNFSRKPAPGAVVERLYARIARSEGHNIATKGVIELALAWKFGAQVFSEGLNSHSFTRGRERFEEATAGVRTFLERVVIKLPTSSSIHCPSGLLLHLAEIWAERKDHKHMLKGMDRRIVAEMEALGFEYGRMLTLPMSNQGLKEGHSVRGRGYRSATIDPESLLELLEMSPVEVCKALRKRNEKAEKGWFMAEAVLLEIPHSPFKREHFLEASSDISWDNDTNSMDNGRGDGAPNRGSESTKSADLNL